MGAADFTSNVLVSDASDRTVLAGVCGSREESLAASSTSTRKSEAVSAPAQSIHSQKGACSVPVSTNAASLHHLSRVESTLVR